MGAVYKGSLNLDKVVGIRHDKGQKATNIKSLLKRDTSLPRQKTSMKQIENVTPDGLQKS